MIWETLLGTCFQLGMILHLDICPRFYYPACDLMITQSEFIFCQRELKVITVNRSYF